MLRHFFKRTILYGQSAQILKTKSEQCGPTQSSPILQNGYIPFMYSYINLSLKFVLLISNTKKFTF